MWHLIWAVPAAFLLWGLIHELSHFVGARLTVGASEPRLWLWPHFHEGKFYWTRIQYRVPRIPTPPETRIVLMAPRLPDLLAAGALPLMPLVGAPLWAWALLAGGVVDLAVGSMGIGEHTDLRRAARYGMLPLLPTRLLGLAAVAMSVVATLLFAFGFGG